MSIPTVKELLIKHQLLFFEKQNNFLIKCLNPEHQDNNPSMSIHKELGVFRCFSCGFKGGFKTLCSVLGEELDEDVSTLELKLKMLTKNIEDLYSQEDTEGIQMPSSYRIHPGPYRDISPAMLKAGEVFISSSEEFHGRVWFPIYHRNKLVCFQGRADIPDLKPKYKFYPKHVNLKHIIYDISRIPAKTVVLVEGVVDMFRLQTAGIREACCIFGSYFNFEKLYTLLAHDVSRVITLYDPDDPGKKVTAETNRVLKKHAPHILCENIWLTGDKDPGDLSDSEIQELFAERLDA